MSKLDKTKEFIGFLKIVFAIVSAIIISFTAWLYQEILTMPTKEIITMLALGLILVVVTYLIGKKILQLINDLEDL